MTWPVLVSIALVLLAVLIEGVLVIGLIKSVYDIRRQIEEIEVERKRVPVFFAHDIAGESVTSSDMIGQPYGMLFITPSSEACHDAITNLAGIKDRTGDDLFVVCQGTRSACRRLLEPVMSEVRTVLDEGGDLHLLFRVQNHPTILVMDEKHRIKMEGKIVPAEQVEV